MAAKIKLPAALWTKGDRSWFPLVESFNHDGNSRASFRSIVPKEERPLSRQVHVGDQLAQPFMNLKRRLMQITLTYVQLFGNLVTIFFYINLTFMWFLSTFL